MRGFMGRVSSRMKNFWERVDKFFDKSCYVALIFVCLYLVLVFLEIDLELDKEILCWVFSTVAQFLVALLALLGMLVIYRLNVLQNELNELRVKEGYQAALFKEDISYSKNNIKRFAKWVIATVTISLIGLACVNILSGSEFALFSVFLVIFMSCYSLKLAYKLIKEFVSVK